jgi:hypothetical protein
MVTAIIKTYIIIAYSQQPKVLVGTWEGSRLELSIEGWA